MVLEEGREALLHGLFDLRAWDRVIRFVLLNRKAVFHPTLEGMPVPDLPQAVGALAQGTVFLGEFREKPAQLVDRDREVTKIIGSAIPAGIGPRVNPSSRRSARVCRA